MENNLKTKFSLSNMLFLLAYIPALAISSFYTTLYNQIVPSIYMNLIVVIALGILLFKFILIDRHSFLEYVAYVFLGTIVTASALNSHNKQFAILIIFCMMAKNIKNDAVIKSYLWVSIGTLVVAYLSTKLGKIPDLMYTRDLIVRHSYGIIYPTDFAAHIFYICCAYVYLRFKNYSFKDMLFLLVIALITYRQTDARLNFGMIILLAISTLLLKHSKLQFVMKKVWMIPIVSFLFTYFATKYFTLNSHFFSILNKLFSGRLGIVQETMNEYGVKWFGQKIIEHGWGGKGFYLNTRIFKYTYIDSSYMRLWIIYGILASVLFLCVITFLLKKVNSKRLILIVSLILLSGIIEQHFIDIAYNPFFILLVADYFKEKETLLTCKNI